VNTRDTLLLSCGTAEDRRQLRSVFTESYNLLEADNTQQMLVLLQQNQHCIAAVLRNADTPEEASLSLQEPELQAALQDLPVIVISRKHTLDQVNSAFALGVMDVIPRDYPPFAMQQRVRNIVDLHLHKRHLEHLVEEQAQQLRHSNQSMVDALSSIIEYRSVESGQHILRIRHFTRILLEEVARCCPEYGLTESMISTISSAAALHDVGKISIPDSILNKPGRLSAEEWAVMRNHTVTGCRILESLSEMGNEEYLRYAHNICHYHHERWNGGGYPEGLAGDAIPICAQVVGIADAYDALTNKRVYKDPYSFQQSANMILNGECGVFSPKLLECFKHVSSDMEALARRYADGLSPHSENFDVTLPPPVHRDDIDTLENVQLKYRALLHFMDVTVMEVDLNQRLFHILYNPYPELGRLTEQTDIDRIKEILLDELVVEEERPAMIRFLGEELHQSLQRGMRRHCRRFFFRHPQPPYRQEYEITLLRPAPHDHENRLLLVLCEKLENGQGWQQQSPVIAEQLLSAPIFRCSGDRDLTIEQGAEALASYLGYSPEELRQHFKNRFLLLADPAQQDQVRQQLIDQLGRGRYATVGYRLQRKNGSSVEVMASHRLVLDPDGRDRIYTTLVEVESLRRQEEQLRKKLQQYEIILAQTENVLFEWDYQSDTIEFSDTWESIFGYSPMRQGLRSRLHLDSHFHPDDIALFRDNIRHLENGAGYQTIAIRIAKADGRYLWCNFRATALYNQQQEIEKIVGVIINVDAEKRASQALQEKAERDTLTKLLNKQAAREQVEHYLSGNPAKIECALLIIDLDNFKQVNDRYGHMFGDSVLTHTARELKRLFRAQDVVARIGGDEFMVMMRGISDRALVEGRCRNLLKILQNTFRGQLYNCDVSCSIGIAMAPEHGIRYNDLFHCADVALYQAKARGKNDFVFFSGEKPHFLSPQQYRATATTRIDSDEQPGLSINSIVQCAFQQLYAAQDEAAAINQVLALIGEQLNVSRVYIFENTPDGKACNNTFEWCNQDIAPQIEMLQGVPYEEIPGFLEAFDERGLFYCTDIRELPEPVYQVLEPQGVKSMLACALRDNGKFFGYMGFDECLTQRIWTKEKVETLTYFAEMIAVFLVKMHAQQSLNQQVADLSRLLDRQDAWLYVVEPESFRLRFLNEKTRRLAPDVQEGMTCYRGLRGLAEPCADCPIAGLKDGVSSHKERIRNQQFSLDVEAEASHFHWENQAAYLLSCREIGDAEDK